MLGLHLTLMMNGNKDHRPKQTFLASALSAFVKGGERDTVIDSGEGRGSTLMWYKIQKENCEMKWECS